MFPDDFKSYGTSEAVRLALHRMVNRGLIKRAAQGIYYRPRFSKLLGELSPTAENIALAIAKRDRIRLVPTGSYALNALGLSTQVPTKLVYLTDGAARLVKVGNRTIMFKKTTPKNLLTKGEISTLVIQALREIGNGRVLPVEEEKILEVLKKENPIYLKHDIDLAPVWIAKIMKKALPNE